MPGGTGGAAHTTAPPADQPDDDDDLSPRDRYILEISNAYKTGAPYGGGGANPIEAQRQRWLKPGARPGTTKDAAISDRAAADEAYRELCRQDRQCVEGSMIAADIVARLPDPALDARIAAAFAEDAKSVDVSRLLAEVEAAASSCRGCG